MRTPGWIAIVSGLLLVTAGSGCVAPTGEDEPGYDGTATVSSAVRRQMLERVVIARMYQRSRWTIPAADAYRPDLYPDRIDRRIAYVCDALSELQPTYVSGLIRLDATQEVTAEQAAIYTGVKRCVRDRTPHRVRFDVVLNALHYGDRAEGAAGPDEGRRLIRARLESASAALGPDVWFFDFYYQPWGGAAGRFPEGMRAGITWIHEHGQLVGGNIWGRNFPDQSDFVAITDKDGMDHVAGLMSDLRNRGIPVMMHIRNDPQIPDSEGLHFIRRGRDYRKDVLTREVAGERLGYTYMFPLFFPLDEDARSYDAVQDGNMLDRFDELMR